MEAGIALHKTNKPGVGGSNPSYYSMFFNLLTIVSANNA